MIAMIFTLVVTLFHPKMSKCSLVIDSGDHSGLYIENYCPKMEFCAEGAHVMCMYYNAKSVMGPNCHNPTNVSITSDLANKILEVSNAIRSKIALGTEKGKGGILLPRAYGMSKLKWDNELATFAQVLANQCVLRHDLCRASKKFPDPGQTAGLVRFTYPEWLPVTNNTHFTNPGLTVSKIDYATTMSLKSWYSQKAFVTPQMIHNYPDWTIQPDKPLGKLYLEMIHDSTTHMGCGISAYTEYAYHDNKAHLNYNSVQIICNYSARSHKGGPVYNTNPPTQAGQTVRCGCSEDYEEDADCLCSEITTKSTPSPIDCNDINCKPAVVLLPIFTVEDAPPEKLARRQGSASNTVHFSGLDNSSRMDDMDIFNAYEVHENDMQFEESSTLPFVESPSNNVLDNIISEPRSKKQQAKARPLNERIQVSPIKNRYFDKKLQSFEHSYRNGQSQRYASEHVSNMLNPHPPKNSIFSRVHTFQLPRKTEFSNQHNMHEIKRDVVPRRDFSNTQLLLKTYLTKKRNKNDIIAQTHPVKSVHTSEKYLNKTEHKPEKFNRYLKNKFHYQDFKVTDESIKPIDIQNSNEDDKKLMNLLDNLEQEVKHIDLDVNEKEMFDAKIRKIYGTVVGKSADLLSPKLRSGIQTEKENVRRGNHLTYESDPDHLTLGDIGDVNKKTTDIKIYEPEDRVKEAHSKLYDTYDSQNSVYPRSLSRKQNSLQYGDNIRDAKCNLGNRSCFNRKPFRDTDYLETRPSFRTQKTYKNNEDFYNRRRYNTINLNRLALSDEISEIEYRNRNKHKLDEIRKNHKQGGHNDMKSSRVHNNDFERSIIYNEDEFRGGSNFNGKDLVYTEPLSVDRRKYYQDKIYKIERKLHENRKHGHRNELDKQRRSTALRATRPTTQDGTMRRKSKTETNGFYIPDRAKFLHGF